MMSRTLREVSAASGSPEDDLSTEHATLQSESVGSSK